MSERWPFPADFLDGDSLLGLSDAAFRPFVALILQCDDEGRELASAARWAKRTARPLAATISAFDELEAAGLVAFYRRGGKGFLFLPGRFEHNARRPRWAVSRFPLPDADALLFRPEYLAGIAALTSKNRLAVDLSPNETWRYPAARELAANHGISWETLETCGTARKVPEECGHSGKRAGVGVGVGVDKKEGDLIGGRVNQGAGRPGTPRTPNFDKRKSQDRKQTPHELVVCMASERGLVVDDLVAVVGAPPPWGRQQIDRAVSYLRGVSKVSESDADRRRAGAARAGAPGGVATIGDVLSGLTKGV